jgi:hypothetical protein
MGLEGCLLEQRPVGADHCLQGNYTEQKLITEETYGHIESLEDLAPL